MSSKFTESELRAALAETGGNMSAAARILGCAKSTVQKAVGRHPDSKAERRAHVVQEPSGPDIKVAAATGGFNLKGKTLMAKKPTDVWGPRFNALRTETGYPPDVLAKQWGASLETVRKKARDAGAVRYTEQDGQYIEVIVHPKTRGGK